MGKICSKAADREPSEKKEDEQVIHQVTASVVAQAPKRRMSQKLDHIISHMSSKEGRSELAGEEAEKLSMIAKMTPPGPQEKDEVQLTAPPVKKGTGDGKYRISGVYKHQVLKAGLRTLDAKWPAENLTDFGHKLLLRGSLIKRLIEGSMRLQSVPQNDVGAAQGDLKQLTLRQVFRIRALHLDYRPSGANVDSISTVGDVYSAFINMMDFRLFKMLGMSALHEHIDDEERENIHHFGLEAVLLSAGYQAFVESSDIPPPTKWMCWCLREGRRVYFDAHQFKVSMDFPKDGVLEIDDKTKRDANEPTGHLLWFDWDMTHTKDESKLSCEPLETRLKAHVVVPASPRPGGQEDPDGPQFKVDAAQLVSGLKSVKSMKSEGGDKAADAEPGRSRVSLKAPAGERGRSASPAPVGRTGTNKSLKEPEEAGGASDRAASPWGARQSLKKAGTNKSLKPEDDKGDGAKDREPSPFGSRVSIKKINTGKSLQGS